MPSRNPSRLLSFLVLSLLGGALRAETTIPFLTERYFPAAGGAAFESIAWNPLTHTLASQDAIRDLCGSFVSTGPAESPGLAWDAVTATYWEITSTRMVRQWNGGTLVDTLFTIPQTFTVPGSGPDTLESVRGIAVDPSFVYVVDAGPDPGEIASNAWFKFTRTGVPVKSSKSTDFTSHLDADPDALVDDIVYVPPTSPVAPGLFLLAFEHSGIYVLTSEGEFRGKLLWSALDIPANLALRAFAGITIDPATGDLFLVDNDAGKAQVWTRIPQDGPTWYAIGSYGTVDHPGSCTRYLWGAAGTPPQTLMGVAYRPADELVYEVDYSTGQLWRFDPMLRTATFAGNTGRSDLWGLAYDTERDVFYVGQDLGGSTQIYSVNPTTYATAPLSQVTAYSLTDLAFNATDRNLYAISGDLVTPRLVRINRNTGAGTIVGNTANVRGIDFDAVSQRLIGADANFVPKLWSINPANGSATEIASPPSGAYNNSGLAVIPVGAAPLGVGPVDGVPKPLLHAVPNPTRGAVSLRLEVDGMSWARVFDASGRLVRTLAGEASGHEIVWDGRTEAGAPVRGGVYFVEAGGATARARRKIIVLE